MGPGVEPARKQHGFLCRGCPSFEKAKVLVFDARSGKGHYGDCAGIGCTMIQPFKSATSNLGTKSCVENNITSTDLPTAKHPIHPIHPTAKQAKLLPDLAIKRPGHLETRLMLRSRHLQLSLRCQSLPRRSWSRRSCSLAPQNAVDGGRK